MIPYGFNQLSWPDPSGPTDVPEFFVTVLLLDEVLVANDAKDNYNQFTK
jgi:hypothetical protein